MQEQEFKTYIRSCKHCDEFYRAKTKESSVCEDCKCKHHKEKIIKNLFSII